MKHGIFVTGTDTGVGKTMVSTLLFNSIRSQGKKAGYFKPIQSGSESDTAWVAEKTEVSMSEFPQPVYSFPEAIAPSRAAQKNGVTMEIDAISQKWESLDSRTWLVEGAGGLMVPVNPQQTLRSLVVALDLPLLLVASTKLGTINHTLLTLEAAKNAWINVLGIILVGDEDPGLEDAISEFSEAPILGRLPIITDLSGRNLKNTAREYFGGSVLERIYEGLGERN